jgi:transposase
MAVRGLGCPVRFTLTGGQKGDAPQAAALIEGLPAAVVMADTAYDADPLRQAIAAKGAIAVIPNYPVTSAQISARQASLRPAPPGGVLFLKTQAIPPCCNPLRKDRTQLPRSRNARSHHLMDAISVHTT